MPVTLRGIYHNLRESKYTISNSEVVFFLSSELYREKFMSGYLENSDKMNEKMNKILTVQTPFNYDTLADIQFYKCIEKRGFFVLLKGVSITWDDLHAYSLRKMSEKQSPLWKRINRPKVVDRITLMSR
jgi:beta-galactosidase beta subunit